MWHQSDLHRERRSIPGFLCEVLSSLLQGWAPTAGIMENSSCIQGTSRYLQERRDWPPTRQKLPGCSRVTLGLDWLHRASEGLPGPISFPQNGPEASGMGNPFGFCGSRKLRH